MYTALLWGGLIAIGIMAVITFRYFSIRRITFNRTPIDLQAIHRSIADKASLDTVKQVFHVLGDAYLVDPRLIRLDDSLRSFSNADSWQLDVGTEQLNKWLQSIGIKEIETQPNTVLDLLLLVESRNKPS
ncbi:MAG: hypothetical protein H8K07_14595 [Nitrospira sp.]|jgi:hypothetical protein|nr:hypothetical protein [Nitrospira sp.]MDI3462971.1 hypothetical protein [Nitrospira sp.]